MTDPVEKDATQAYACDRLPCWLERGHDGPCEPGSRLDPRRVFPPAENDETAIPWGRQGEICQGAEDEIATLLPPAAENDVPQVCWDRHGTEPCPHPLCACLAGHHSPHHNEQGRNIPPGFREPPEGWFTFGTHVDEPVSLEFSDEADDGGMPLWERPIPHGRQDS